MKKWSRLTAVILTICMVLALAACGAKDTNEGSEDKKQGDKQESGGNFNWDFFLSLPQSYTINKGLLEYVDTIKEKTEGNVNINVYSAGELPYTGTEAIDICAQGTVQMADGNSANIAGSTKTGAICTYPFLCTDWDDFHTMMDTVTPYFAQEMKEQGVHVLFFLPDPLQYMFGKGEPLGSWKDMKGRSMRAQNSYMQEFASKVGANSISITSNEIATAISKGVIDSFVTASLTTESSKYYEFIDWANATPFSSNGHFIMINQTAWESLPQEYQKVIEEEGQKLVDDYWDKFVPEQNEWALGVISDNKTAVSEPDEKLSEEGRELIQDSYEKWAQEAGGLAPETLEAVKKVLGY